MRLWQLPFLINQPPCPAPCSARRFDEHPVLKALICRNAEQPLPQPLDDVVAVFLGGLHRSYFWPAPLAPQSVVEAVRTAFRFPLDEPGLGGGFQGLRYLSGLLSIAEKHGMLAPPRPPSDLPFAAGASCGGGRRVAQLLADPERGAVLIAHPCLAHWFARSTLLLCQHSTVGGAYGLCLNKPLDGSVKDLAERIQQSTGSSRSLGPAVAGTRAFATATGPTTEEGRAPLLAAETEPVAAPDACVRPAAESPEDFSDSAASKHAEILEGLVRGIQMDAGIGSLDELEVIDGDDLLMQLAAAVEASHRGGSDEEVGAEGEQPSGAASESDIEVEEIILGRESSVPAIRALIEAMAAQSAGRSGGDAWQNEGGAPLMLSTGHLLSGDKGGADSIMTGGTDSGGPLFGDSSGSSQSADSSCGGGVNNPGDGAGAAAVGSVSAKQLMGLFAGSSLFRGGPVAGVQILHCRAQLGGQEVLPPSPGSEGVFLGCDASALAEAPGLFKRGHLAEGDVK